MVFIRLLYSPVDSLLHHVGFSPKHCCIRLRCSVFLPGSPTGRDALYPGWQPLRAAACCSPAVIAEREREKTPSLFVHRSKFIKRLLELAERCL